MRSLTPATRNFEPWVSDETCLFMMRPRPAESMYGLSLRSTMRTGEVRARNSFWKLNMDESVSGPLSLRISVLSWRPGVVV